MFAELKRNIEEIWSIIPAGQKPQLNTSDSKFHSEATKFYKKFIGSKLQQSRKSPTASQSTERAAATPSRDNSFNETLLRMVADVKQAFENDASQDQSPGAMEASILRQFKQFVESRYNSDKNRQVMCGVSEIADDIAKLQLDILQLRQIIQKDRTTVIQQFNDTVEACYTSILGFSRTMASIGPEEPDRRVLPVPTGSLQPGRSDVDPENGMKNSDIKLSDVKNSGHQKAQRPFSQSRVTADYQNKIQKTIIGNQSQQIKDLIQDYNRQQAEIEQLTQQVQNIKQLNNRIFALQRKVEELTGQVRSKEYEYEVLQRDHNTVTRQCQLLNKQVSKMLENQAKTADVAAENEQLKQQNQEHKAQVESCQQENDQLNQIIDTQVETISNLQKQRELLEAEISEIKEKMAASLEESTNQLKLVFEECDSNTGMIKQQLQNQMQEHQKRSAKLIRILYGIAIFLFLACIATKCAGHYSVSKCRREQESARNEMLHQMSLGEEQLSMQLSEKEQQLAQKYEQDLKHAEMEHRLRNASCERRVTQQYAMLGGAGLLSLVLLVVVLVK